MIPARVQEIQARWIHGDDVPCSGPYDPGCRNCVIAFLLGLVADLSAELDQLREAGRRWADARDQTNHCHDEFGWDQGGYEACEAWRDAEDTAADALAALAGSADRTDP